MGDIAFALAGVPGSATIGVVRKQCEIEDP